MKSKKKAALLAIVVVLALLFALPPTRDELDWRWTQSSHQAANYMQYFTDWPKGRHAAEARTRYEQRTWDDTKRTMINEAKKKHTAANSDPKAGKALRMKRERFFWREVTNENTLTSYKDYLTRYPNGEFIAQARRQIDDLTRQTTDGGSKN